MKQEKGDSPSPSQSRITLSGLLNALDGVGAQEGRILFATTNRYSALDPALCRPGRMDIHVEFKLASKFQAEELYKCFYLPSESISHDALPCLTEKINMDEDTDSGYGSAKHSPSPNKTELLLEIDELTELVTVSPQTSLLFSGNSHRTRAPNLSRFEIESLARRFAGSIPDREYSMASLQGYLMTYKSRPIEAVQGVGAWVMREREEKSGKLASRGKREV